MCICQDSVSVVSTDKPSDVTPPADDYIRTGTAYTAKAQEATHETTPLQAGLRMLPAHLAIQMALC